MSEQSEKSKEIVESLKQKFKEERKNWKQKIREIASKMYKTDDMVEAQVNLFTERQFLVDYNHELMAILSTLNRKYRERKKISFIEYNENYDFKLQKGEKDLMIEGDLSILKERIEILGNQIKHYDQTIQTIDHMLYGIKPRIQLEEFRRK